MMLILVSSLTIYIYISEDDLYDNGGKEHHTLLWEATNNNNNKAASSPLPAVARIHY